MLNFPDLEKKILKFWQEKKIFEKSLKKTEKGKRFVFFEGPPFANGLPGIHHLLSRAFKDIILRYKTMQGFYVERKAGWDTHGLPTEMEAEKKLGIRAKKDIEKIGIEKFIQQCRDSVFTYKKEWEEFTERIGFWLDLKNAYITCSNDYIETLWWILKQIWEKGLLYQDYKVVPYCPRCGTSLSSHEVAQGYKKIAEPAIYIKLKIKNTNQKSKNNTYLLVWTTTPWTLPGNVAIAVNPEFTYSEVKIDDEYLILAKERLSVLNKNYELIREFEGKDLVDLRYEPLYSPNEEISKIAYKIIPADFVSSEEGTGIVHIAPAFGEDDMGAGKANNLPILTTVDEEGRMLTKNYPWDGKFIKEADPLIIQNLKNRDIIFHTENYEHEYPFCWRCDSPLFYYAKTSWFIKMSSLKEKLIENNKKINWIPEYLKEGRFGEWLRELQDWNLSRERYWGTPLPIWQCKIGKNQKFCDNIKVIGSIKELEKLSDKKIKDLHRPYIDEITFRCEKCGGVMKRIPEVADCWFDSGSMPYAQWHYPFENQDRIDKKQFFPADFICEGIDQTRGWFYTLLAVSTLLDLGPAYKNVISHGIVLDAEGKKMSKSKGNIVLPKDVVDKYGADCSRFYFYTINPVAEPKRFDFKDVQEIFRRVFDTLWNSYIFFSTYTDSRNSKIRTQNSKLQIKNQDYKKLSLLDQWIVSGLHNLITQVIKNLDKYYVVEAARLFEDFVDDLSNWYIRRSRRRFQKPESTHEKENACQTLYYILFNFTKLLAPFAPFISEEIYQELIKGRENGEESVHLCDYPKPDKKLINQKIEQQMKEVREIVAEALALRAEAGIKVRQPLASLEIPNTPEGVTLRRPYGAGKSPARGEARQKRQIPNEILELIREEVNVKKIFFGKSLKLDTKITLKLKEEGIIRAIIRNIQAMRKEAGYTPKDRILIQASGDFSLEKILRKNKKLILEETKADKIEFGEEQKQVFTVKEDFKIDQKNIQLAIKKTK